MKKQYRGKNSTCIIDIRQVGEIRWILKEINEFWSLISKITSNGGYNKLSKVEGTCSVNA